MQLLTDIAVAHVYKGKNSTCPLAFTMHPFENSTGEHAGRFEVLHTREEGGKLKKRSAHLTKAELAELFAYGLPEKFNLRLRMRPASGVYPDAPPGKRISSKCVASGSEFDRMVRKIDVHAPASSGLKEQLNRLSLLAF